MGCSQPSIKKYSRIQMRSSMFLGKTITRFVLDNGMPYKKRKLSSGEYIYFWNSKIVSNPFISIVEDNLDDFVRGECELEILTTSKGKITSIVAKRDEARDWDPSECSDALK